MSKRILGYYPATGSIEPFGPWFDEAYDLEDYPEKMQHISCLLLWGGTDIASSLYTDITHPKNQNRMGIPSNRDRREWHAMKCAIERGIPMIGVCRGAQMLCAGAGGYLFQHITQHEGSNHVVYCIDGDEFETNSCHHQMMSLTSKTHPNQTIGAMLAYAQHPHCVIEKDFAHQKVNYPQVEAAFYADTKGLAIQWHPEWMPSVCQATMKIGEWIEEYIVPSFPKSAPARVFNQRQPA